MNKLATLALLRRNGVPVPDTIVLFGNFIDTIVENVKKSMEFPVVVKPIEGSWGKLISLVRDEEELRSILEHKMFISGSYSKVHLVQRFINKPGRDIRLVTLGEEAVCAIYRVNEKHWITNTARGARAVPLKIDSELEDLAVKVAKLVGGEFLGLDIIEDPSRGYLVNEVNAVPEFKNCVAVACPELPELVVGYLASKARS